MKHQYAWALSALIFTTGALAGSADPAYQRADLPIDTVLKVRLNDTIRSDRSQPGDHFTASVQDPYLPNGTLVEGVVIGVTPANKETRGRLGVDFQTLELPGGRRIPIAASPTGLDSKSVRTTSSGGLVARSHGRSNTGKYIAYGAAGGLAIGSLFERNVLGGLVGAGAGFLVGRHKHHEAERRNVVLKEGTKLGVRLDQTVVLARS